MSDILKKITTRAKAIRKAHPGKEWKMCIKQAAAELRTGKKAPAKKAAARKPAVKKRAAAAKVGKKKRAAPKKTAAKRAAPAKAPRKVKTIIRTKKGGGVTLKIGGIGSLSLTKINSELVQQRTMEGHIKILAEKLKQKLLKAAEKAAIRRDIVKYKNALKASKQHVTALKRSI